MLKIIIDENIAFAREAFNYLGQVILLPGKKITNQDLKNADILIIRSVTKVNEALLKNTSVKFVGTATIGTDHIDIEYLNKNNIAFADAKGCNAFSVAEYVIASLLYLANKSDFVLRGKNIGIVGVGNIGSKVAKFAKALGMNLLLNDPPLQRITNNRDFVNLDKILEADIITLHVPLNSEGVDRTYHLFDKARLSKINNGTIIINSSRGAVINNSDLFDLISDKKLKVVLDVWENEPEINIGLLKKVMIGTPHIAGYSWEGKVNGTLMIYNSLCNFLGVEQKFSLIKEFPQNSLLGFDESDKMERNLENLIENIYPIQNDDLQMRKMLNMDKEERIKYFDWQRKNYPKRREFDNYSVQSENLSDETKTLLEQLRFKII